MIITIGGLAGTGTSTTAKKLSESLDIPFISAGDVFRQLAVENDMDLLEFSEFAEGNNEIDKALDERQVQIANEADDIIVEGRISAFFVDADFKIWLMTPIDVRAERICIREDKSLETVKYEIEERSASEKKRYQEIYDIDINDLGIYDLIINTSTFDEDATANIILESINENK